MGQNKISKLLKISYEDTKIYNLCLKKIKSTQLYKTCTFVFGNSAQDKQVLGMSSINPTAPISCKISFLVLALPIPYQFAKCILLIIPPKCFVIQLFRNKKINTKNHNPKEKPKTKTHKIQIKKTQIKKNKKK